MLMVLVLKASKSLRKLRVKRPYLVQGGFQSWVKQGIQAKELKPETMLTILNEEAEAILEDIKPSPVQTLGYGVGFAAASYALLEWEKTLQFIAIIGLSQTIYQRIASYNGPEDFKQDVYLWCNWHNFVNHNGNQVFSLSC
uniref:Rhodanese domain-containing protein n=1 Tax=Populus trichocarpa TaxID=3694 RepID=A0A3N7HDX2_POPTR